MCLILFAYRMHPTYRLIVAANRDEFYGRPTAPAQYWADDPRILAGRDLLKMGTWMGVTTTGRFAALTNVRNPQEVPTGKRSRGELVADYLKSDVTPEQYIKQAARTRDDYPGYNLLAWDRDELYYYSNVGDAPQRLEPGVYGVSNHLLNTPWPKVVRGREGLAELLKGNGDPMTERLFDLLRHDAPAPDEHLPRTGVPLEWERLLSPMFVRSEAHAYGTRTSTVVFMSEEEIRFQERSRPEEGDMVRSYSVRLQ
ncbi:NRDE family protein [Paenibacillus sp.]|uniref:NRDE family protein n=1 Tax=Paenibacillus sp. TaxID=58172 RepID=UPI002810E1BD|nr:NRDE family protein [Paenibacillus sp.]